jgi:hypothetical protein
LPPVPGRETPGKGLLDIKIRRILYATHINILCFTVWSRSNISIIVLSVTGVPTPYPVAGIGSLSFSRAGTGMDAGIDPDDAEEISGGTLLSYHRYYAAGLLIWNRQRRQRPGL